MTNKTPKELVKSRQQKIADFSERIFDSAIKKYSTKKQDTTQNSAVSETEKLKQEIAALKSENFNLKTLSALEKSGCVKPELVMKAVPENCENLQDWIDSFKSENEILFKQPPQNHGGNYKPTNCTNLSPSELMNNYIRGIH